jgi:hypothetical protein
MSTEINLRKGDMFSFLTNSELDGEMVHPVSGLTMEEMRKRLAQFI